MATLKSLQADITVEVRERSDTPISGSVLQLLQRSRGMAQLINSGIVGLVCGKQGWAVRGNQFVGAAILENGVRLKVVEKTSGALAALLRSAMPRDVRRERVESSPMEQGDGLVFIQAFLGSLREALRRGRHKEWFRYRERSVTPRGALDIPGTIALRLQGRRPQIVQNIPSVTAHTSVNQLLKTALIVCERWSRTPGAPQQEVMREVRQIAPALADIDATSLLRTPRRHLSSFCRAVLQKPNINCEMRKALLYAQTIVLQSFTGDGGDRLDESLFWNLETLFESAVRSSAQTSPLFSGWRVYSGDAARVPLFTDNTTRFIARPDVVVRNVRAHIMIADCKYVDIKDAEQSRHSHIYQLLAHASAYAVGATCLFYPGTTFGGERLGVTRGGVSVHSFTVRFANLEDDVHAAIANVMTDTA